MKSLFPKYVVIAALAGASAGVQAGDGMGIGVGARASTLGAGVELGKSFSDYFSVRLGLNDYSRSETQSIDNIDYSADLDLSSTSLMFDWHPFGGSFRWESTYNHPSASCPWGARDQTTGQNHVDPRRVFVFKHKKACKSFELPNRIHKSGEDHSKSCQNTFGHGTLCGCRPHCS